jgi:hypothetical protein
VLGIFLVHLLAHENVEEDPHANDEADSEHAQQTRIATKQNFERHNALLLKNTAFVHHTIVAQDFQTLWCTAEAGASAGVISRPWRGALNPQRPSARVNQGIATSVPEHKPAAPPMPHRTLPDQKHFEGRL